MVFYQSSLEMNSHLENLLDQIEKDSRPGLKNSIAITWIRYDRPNPIPGSGIGTGLSQNQLLYPASVVKLVYAIAIEEWIQKDIVPDSEELRRAMKNMIKNSSNDATGLLVDLLTGTNSGPSLNGKTWECWKQQRELINKWLENFNWPELKNINCCQKTWSDGPYGRDRDFYGPGNLNRNSLSTDATARLLEGVMTNAFISPPACKRIRNLLSRSLDLTQRKEDPENQVDGFLGQGLAPGTQLWSKAGLMSQARHDAAWWSSPKGNQGNPMLLVIFTQGRERANDTLLLPTLAKEINSLEFTAT